MREVTHRRRQPCCKGGCVWCVFFFFRSIEVIALTWTLLLLALLQPSTSDPEQLYVLVEKIGKGAFGVVYKGYAPRDPLLCFFMSFLLAHPRCSHSIPRSSTKPIAVKVLDLEAAKDEIEDLQKEISMLALCRSPHIIDTHGSFVKGPKLWIFMELMIGSASDLVCLFFVSFILLLWSLKFFW